MNKSMLFHHTQCHLTKALPHAVLLDHFTGANKLTRTAAGILIAGYSVYVEGVQHLLCS